MQRLSLRGGYPVRHHALLRGRCTPQPQWRLRAVQKPQWVKSVAAEDLETDAEFDDAAARVLEGTDGDPERILEKIRAEQEQKEQEIVQARTGVSAQVDIRFREVDPFNLWIWLEFYSAPSVSDRDLLNEVLQSWFVVGKLGGYNSANLQVSYGAADAIQWFPYDQKRSYEVMDSFIHELEPAEFNGLWGRFRVDMGTADELCIDVLINMMTNFSKEYVGIKTMIVGGENASWPVPEKKKPDIEPDASMEAATRKARSVMEEAERETEQMEADAEVEDANAALAGDMYLDDLIGPDVEFE